MLEFLTHAERPVTGAALSGMFGVSRQVVVKDIARLRSEGAHILATPDGYHLLISTHERVFRCRHIGREQLVEELYLMVDNGGLVVDVLIEHSVYGKLRTPLNLRSRRDVDTFANNLYGGGSQPMSALTDGIHLHTVRAVDAQALDVIEAALRGAGILYPDG